MSGGRVALANQLKAFGRGLSPRSTAEAAGVLAVAATTLAFVVGEYAGLAFLLRLARRGFEALPELAPAILLERLLLGAFATTGALLLLGSVTTAVSTLFLSEEVSLRRTLPIPHARLLLRQAAATTALASGPAVLLALALDLEVHGKVILRPTWRLAPCAPPAPRRRGDAATL